MHYSAPEDSRTRELVAYPTASLALQDATALVDLFASCPQESFDGGTSGVTTEVLDSSWGDRGWTVLRTYRMGDQPTIGEDVFQVIVVGQVLLVTEEAGEGPGATAPARARRSALAAAGELQSVLDALCDFSERGCAG